MINYSIIIPHYNIPDLLMRCLKSVPVREDVQVIVVDDCSPDFESYRERYPELSRPYLELYQTPIGGSAGRARNVGLEHAKGKWLIFMDADDLFVENVAELLDEDVESNADIIFYDTLAVMNDDLSQPSNRNFYHKFFDKYAQNGDETNLRYHFHSLWGKVFRHGLVMDNDLQFDATRYSNDVYFSATTGYYAKLIQVKKDPLFIVTERDGSLASSQYGHKPTLYECEIRLKEAVKVKKFYESKNLALEEKQYYYYLSIMRSYYKFAYFKNIVTLLFTHPSYLKPVVNRDLRFIQKKLSHVKS